MLAIPRVMSDLHKQLSVNTTRQTAMSQSLPSQSREGNFRENNVTYDEIDKGKILGKLGAASSTQAMHSKHAQ